MKKALIYVVFLMTGMELHAQSPVRLMPYLQQPGLYYTSEHVTGAGIGFGAGLLMTYKNHLLAQGDMNIYWMNGNAFSTRISAGYKKSGFWAPAVQGTFAILWGSRTEVLLDNGRGPAYPTLVAGLRISPLRFETEKGFISLLEVGYGLGGYKGACYDVTILAVGLKLK